MTSQHFGLGSGGREYAQTRSPRRSEQHVGVPVVQRFRTGLAKICASVAVHISELIDIGRQNGDRRVDGADAGLETCPECLGLRLPGGPDEADGPGLGPQCGGDAGEKRAFLVGERYRRHVGTSDRPVDDTELHVREGADDGRVEGDRGGLTEDDVLGPGCGERSELGDGVRPPIDVHELHVQLTLGSVESCPDICEPLVVQAVGEEHHRWILVARKHAE